MASLLPDIPVRFMDPKMKFELINWMAEQGFPYRIGEIILHQWAAALNVTTYPSDFELIRNHFHITKG